MKFTLPGFVISLCILLEAVSFLTVAAQTETPVDEKTKINSSTDDKINRSLPSSTDLIHFGDLIEIDVVGSTEYDWRGKLNPEGFLSGATYLQDSVYGLCQSEEQLAAEIARAYGKFLANPQIVVRILDKSGRPLTVLNGAVRAPAKFQIERSVRLNELLINAGGINENASGEIEILRTPGSDCSTIAENSSTSASNGVLQSRETRTLNIKISDLISGDENANPYILSGDYVTVKKAQPIYIVGNIVEPRKLDSRDNLTISRAVTAAGGFAKNSDLNKILIYRIIDGETKVIEVNFQNLQPDDENDVKLQPLDIVEVLAKGSARKPFAPIVDSGENTIKNTNLPLKIIR